MPARDAYRPGEICWVDLNAHDMTTAAGFYRRIFGWSSDAVDTGGGPPYRIFRLRGKSVAGLGQMDPAMRAAGVPACWNTYVRVDDCAATEAKARALGATVTVPTMAAAGAGLLAFLQDPQGANVALWQPLAHHGAELRDEPGALAWIECATPDVAAAKAFYGALFGWTFADMAVGGTAYTIILAGTTGIGGLMAIAPEWGAVPPHWLPYFGTAGVEGLAAGVRDVGGRVVAGPMDISPEHGRFVVLCDPQGAVFAGHQAPPAAAATAAPKAEGKPKAKAKGKPKPRSRAARGGAEGAPLASGPGSVPRSGAKRRTRGSATRAKAKGTKKRKR